MPLPLLGVVAGAVARGAIMTARRSVIRGQSFGRGGIDDAMRGFARDVGALSRGVSEINPQIQIEGLAQLRRDLRAIDAGLSRELNVELRQTVNIAARDAATLAPRRTGKLARSYKPFTRGNIAGVRSPLPYAPVNEYGGTIRPRGVPIDIRRSQPVSRAVERNADRIAEELGDRIEDLARRHGFK